MRFIRLAVCSKSSSACLIALSALVILLFNLTLNMPEPCAAQMLRLPWAFDSESWKKSPNARLAMMGDLKRKHKLIGMHRKDLVDLLGKPDGVSFQLLTIWDVEEKRCLQLHFTMDGKNCASDCVDYTASKQGVKMPIEKLAPDLIKVGSAGVLAMSLDEVEEASLRPYDYRGSYSYLLNRSWLGSTVWLDLDMHNDRVEKFQVNHYGPNHC